MRIIEKKNLNGEIKHIDIVLSNGKSFRASEDIEGMLEITKEYNSDRIYVNPRYSNQICIG